MFVLARRISELKFEIVHLVQHFVEPSDFNLLKLSTLVVSLVSSARARILNSKCMDGTVMVRNHFENDYDRFNKSDEIVTCHNKISHVLQKRLADFKNNKLNILTTQMSDHIYCDGSVYTGSCGLAFYYYNCSLQHHDDKINLLKAAWKYVNLENLKAKRISFLCGDAGPLALAAVISFKLGDEKLKGLPEYKVLISRLMSLDSLLKESPDEILYGKSGYLYSLLFVNKHIGQQMIPENHIKRVINTILHCGQRLSDRVKSESPLLWQWHDKIYFGAAHGMAGILYLILQAMEYVEVSDMTNLTKPTIDYLICKQFPSGNFPSSLSNKSDRLVQWCHGAPGFVPLLLLAHEIFKEEKYLTIALKCGEVVWERGLCTKGYSICHGVSGNAYTFIQLYQATKDPIQLYRACSFIDWFIKANPDTERHAPDRPASLYEGLTGLLYTVEDINNIEAAKFPAFTV